MGPSFNTSQAVAKSMRIESKNMGRCLPVCVAWGLLLGPSAAGTQRPDALELTPSWDVPSRTAVRQPVLAWLRETTDDAQVVAEAERLWSGEPAEGGDRLERLAETVALVDERLGQLVDAVQQGSAPEPSEVRRWSANVAYPPVVKHNIHLFFGRAWVRTERFDAALQMMEPLEVDAVCDPSSLLFYRAVARHGLVRIDTAAEDIARLLQRESELPQRYRDVGRLMYSDLQGIRTDSADHIARRMGDIRRRLALGQVDKRVRKVQDGVIESLDKLIEKLEAAEKAAQQQAGQGGSRQIQSNSPAQDSLPLGGRGEGKVQKKDIGDTPGWGNLPSKQREEALQEIARDFPAHYRDVIQQYFRKLATENDQ